MSNYQLFVENADQEAAELVRLVALNQQRAVEEAQGIVHGFVPISKSHDLPPR